MSCPSFVHGLSIVYTRPSESHHSLAVLALALGPHWATGTRNVTGCWALASGATLQRHSDRDVTLNNIYIYITRYVTPHGKTLYTGCTSMSAAVDVGRKATDMLLHSL